MRYWVIHNQIIFRIKFVLEHIAPNDSKTMKRLLQFLWELKIIKYSLPISRHHGY